MFVLRVDGEEVVSIDQQVTKVRILTPRGEVAAVGVAPNEAVFDIIIDKVAAGGPLRLDQLEAQGLQDIRDRAVEGQPVGSVPTTVTPIAASQGIAGPNDNPSMAAPPIVDLATGLVPADTAVLTARIEAFGSHGDATKAIADNKPTPPDQIPAAGASTTASADTVPAAPEGSAPAGTVPADAKPADTKPADMTSPATTGTETFKGFTTNPPSGPSAPSNS